VWGSVAEVSRLGSGTEAAAVEELDMPVPFNAILLTEKFDKPFIVIAEDELE
jgi:hypothetical protein